MNCWRYKNWTLAHRIINIKDVLRKENPKIHSPNILIKIPFLYHYLQWANWAVWKCVTITVNGNTINIHGYGTVMPFVFFLPLVTATIASYERQIIIQLKHFIFFSFVWKQTFRWKQYPAPHKKYVNPLILLLRFYHYWNGLCIRLVSLVEHWTCCLSLRCAVWDVIMENQLIRFSIKNIIMWKSEACRHSILKIWIENPVKIYWNLKILNKKKI